MLPVVLHMVSEYTILCYTVTPAPLCLMPYFTILPKELLSSLQQHDVVRLFARPQHRRMANGKLHLLHGQVGDDMVDNCTVGGLDPCSTQ